MIKRKITDKNLNLLNNILDDHLNELEQEIDTSLDL